MKILLVYPECPNTFMSYKYALKFISKKAAQPPLGLLTVAAMLPVEWEQKLIDMNVAKLRDKDLKWADYVFISAMSIQKKSVQDVLKRCTEMKVKTVVGGPLFTAEYRDFNNVDCFVLNEAELTLPPFLEDIKKGKLKKIYASTEFADLRSTPLPKWELVDMKKYAVMNVQYSRGCPYSCDFCDISVLFGHKVRTKNEEHLRKELDALHESGWKGDVFFVDDNFIGNKKKLKGEILPSIINWMKGKERPFSFQTEVSINLADDKELISLMLQAGFDSVFVGIETTNDESLEECGKLQNKNRDMLNSVNRIQKSGLTVTAGFIVGFDNDQPTVFEKLYEFIQNSGIVTAMVGLLNAPRDTKLHKRLLKEGRLIKEVSGDNTDFSINFVPRMNSLLLINGYRSIIKKIYSPGPYYERVMKFLKKYDPFEKKLFSIKFGEIRALLKTMIILGVLGKERLHYWKLFFWAILKKPSVFRIAITMAVYGFHFRKVLDKY